MPGDVEADYVVGALGGTGRGLVDAADEHDGRLVVIGSAADGREGSIRIGSTANQLLHGAATPVTLVPDSYATRGVAALDRVSVAYSHTVDVEAALVATRQVVGRTQLPIRLVTLVQYPPPQMPGAARALDSVRADARLWLEQARGSVPDAEAEIAEGEDIGSALASLDWLPGESLLVGSAEYGPVRRVFLGDTAGRILRTAQVPVTVLPRGVEPSSRRPASSRGCAEGSLAQGEKRPTEGHVSLSTDWVSALPSVGEPGLNCHISSTRSRRRIDQGR